MPVQMDRIAPKGVDGVLHASQFPGSDIGAKINAAFAFANNQCTVFVAAGNYSFSTTILYPLSSTGVSRLVLDSGAVLTYTGSGDAISALSTVGNSSMSLNIEGGTLIGTSSAANGIHLQAFNRGTIKSVNISGFTNGYGIFNEGANSILYLDNNIFQCKDGIHQVGKVVGGNNYSPNACHIIGGQIFQCSRWGWFEDIALASTVGAGINNSAYGVVFESNGTNGQTSGHIFIQSGNATDITNCYFEYDPGSTVFSSIAVGDAAQAVNTVTGCVVSGCSFLSQAGNTCAVSLANVNGARVVGNLEDGTPTNFVNHNGAKSRGCVIGQNTGLAVASTFTGGTDSTEVEVHDVNSTYLNALGPGIRGFSFNSISGLQRDLAIRTRGGGTNCVVFQNAGAGSQIASLSDAGLLTIASEVLTAAAPTVSAGQVGLGSTHATTVGAAGGATALPATPSGYLIINVEGTNFKLPYYAN